MALETSVYSPLNHLTRWLTRKQFIEFSCYESVKLMVRHMFQVAAAREDLAVLPTGTKCFAVNLVENPFVTLLPLRLQKTGSSNA